VNSKQKFSFAFKKSTMLGLGDLMRNVALGDVLEKVGL